MSAAVLLARQGATPCRNSDCERHYTDKESATSWIDLLSPISGEELTLCFQDDDLQSSLMAASGTAVQFMAPFRNRTRNGGFGSSMRMWTEIGTLTGSLSWLDGQFVGFGNTRIWTSPPGRSSDSSVATNVPD